MAPTPPPNDSLPIDDNVIHIDGWGKARASGVGHRARRRSEADIDDGRDSDEPVTGADKWWSQALAAFKAYIELKAEDGRDIVLYSHGGVGQSLLQGGLLDELKLWAHPVIVKRGTLLFRPANTTN